MKHQLGLFFALCMLFLGVSCEPETVQYEVSLSQPVLEMTIGEIRMLTATTTAPSVTWESSNDAVATVFNGAITAVGVGYTDIAAVVEGNKATCKVYVKGKKGETLSLAEERIQLEKGKSHQLVYSSVYDVALVWASSNPEIVSVSETGLITALKAGNSFITLSNGLETCTTLVAVPHTWGEYQLVWSDEFDGTSLNMDNWNIEVTATGGGNKELQYYTDRAENVRVENGNLILQARKETYTQGLDTREYTSGRINSKNKKTFKYGKVEARISFPAGGGTWPAFWMLGQNRSWPSCGEIDIIEYLGNKPEQLSFAVHTSARNGMNNNWYSLSSAPDIANNYHIYGIEWIEEDFYGCDRINFTYDGQVLANILEDGQKIDDTYYWPFNQDFFIIFNLAIGGTLGGDVDDNIFDNDILMQVDWVRVWQRQEQE